MLDMPAIWRPPPADAAAASVAFSAVQGGSACPGEENLDKEGQEPHPTDIAGADEAFSIGFVDPTTPAA